MAWTRRSGKKLITPPSLEAVAPTAKAVREIHAQAADSDARISPDEVKWTIGFLNYFGYLGNKNVQELEYADFNKAIAEYQKHTGLSSSGVLDQKTANAMQAPRCGVCDVDPLRMQMRLLGESLPTKFEPKWHKPEIFYYHDEYVDGIPVSVQEDIVATAYGHWSKVCGLRIGCTRDGSKADIILSTGKGPRNQFDGPGNTLAWAYLPPGDDRQLMLMYDQEETWAAEITGTPREVLLENVTGHEGGHTLGLDHSTVQTALMASYYSHFANKPVEPDDIQRIVGLYGLPPAIEEAPKWVVDKMNMSPTNLELSLKLVGGK